ncbi:MAG TPA: glucoamylase family protein [Terriglobales bacterium]|nr:glucoamylase family protein [Terriglobales bacterium]
MQGSTSTRLTRRRILQQILGAGACWPAAKLAWALAPPQNIPAKPPYATKLSADDDNFLQDLESANFRFFWEQANPLTGLVKDRCNVRASDNRIVGSIAATGFGLTALCIGDRRGFVAHPDAQERVLTTLKFLWRTLPNHRGFFYHWANINTGERVWDSEVSSVDTAILLCGILTCRQYFRDPEIERLARQIFDRVDWTWLSEDTPLLPHGWTPEVGFLPSRWDYYSELMMMYLLGMGSYSHPLRASTWTAWKRLTFEYDGLRYIGAFAPLFVHQYSQAWFDFRYKQDAYADYFQNSVIATDAHRLFCLELSREFPDYSDDLWGITASDSEDGYVIWGGPPAMGPIDGTVVPSAPGGSIPFLSQPVMRVLRNIRARYGNAWCQYGFVNAFNPLKKWYDTDVIGIDTGITMVMAENARTGFVWETFMKNPEARRGMARAGFKEYSFAEY